MSVLSKFKMLPVLLLAVCAPLTAPPAKRCPPRDTLVVGQMPDSIVVLRGCR